MVSESGIEADSNVRTAVLRRAGRIGRFYNTG
jgi:hypothetical protein